MLGKVDALRKKVLSVGKEHASLCAKVRLLNPVEDKIIVFFMLVISHRL